MNSIESQHLDPLPQEQSSAITAALLPLPVEDDQLIRAGDLPRYTGIASQTHARWRTEGVGPRFVYLGRRVFYRAGELRRWIKEQERQYTIGWA